MQSLANLSISRAHSHTHSNTVDFLSHYIHKLHGIRSFENITKLFGYISSQMDYLLGLSDEI